MSAARAVRSRSRPATRAFALGLSLALPALALAPFAAAAEPGIKPAKTDRYDPDNVTAISPYMEMIAKGTERFVAKDYTAAIDTYKKAIQLSPKSALAPYLLAEAYLQSNNVGEAESAIATALEANESKNPALRSRVLFVAADIQERLKKWEKAKVAWQAYAEHTARFADAGFPQTASDRLKSVQRVLDMEKPYAAVRDRIAADKADAGKGAPAKK